MMASAQASTNNLLWFKGRGRGKRPDQKFSPSRRPGEKPAQKPNTPPVNVVSGQAATGNDSQTKQEALKTATDVQSVITKGQRYLAKYNYKANPDSPLGREVSLTLGESVTAEEKHTDNGMWWKVSKGGGESGYVPAKYLHKVEQKITMLPWLANRQLDAEEDSNPPAVRGPPKPYVSAYNKPEKEVVQKKKYFCDVCERDFNGPQPYSAHMTSKAHKLEVELAEERERDEAANS